MSRCGSSKKSRHLDKDDEARQQRTGVQLEALLEEARIKLSSLVSDLLGASARRMLQVLAEGETDPAALAPGRGRERGSELQPALAEGEPAHASPSQSGRQCCRQT